MDGTGQKQLAAIVLGGALVANALQRAETRATDHVRTDVLYRMVAARRRWYRRLSGTATVIELLAGAAVLLYVQAHRAG